MSTPEKVSGWVPMEIWWAGEEMAREYFLCSKALDATGEETGMTARINMRYAF